MIETEVKPKKSIPNAELDNVKNYIAINIAYDFCISLPYKEGVAFMAALEHAEKIKMNGYGKKEITFLPDAITVETVVFSQKQYREGKMDLLLGVEND